MLDEPLADPSSTTDLCLEAKCFLILEVLPFERIGNNLIFELLSLRSNNVEIFSKISITYSKIGLNFKIADNREKKLDCLYKRLPHDIAGRLFLIYQLQMHQSISTLHFYLFGALHVANLKPKLIFYVS